MTCVILVLMIFFVLLSFQGVKLRRLAFTKQHTELVIKEIWSLKTMNDESRQKAGHPKFTLPDFYMQYIEGRSETKKGQMEFSYSFVSSLEKYIADADVELFLNILFCEIGEENYYDQMTMIAHLKKVTHITYC